MRARTRFPRRRADRAPVSKQAAGIAADIVAGADQRLEALADGAQHVIANLDAVAFVERSQRTELKNEQVGDRLRRCGRQMLRITTSPPARLRSRSGDRGATPAASPKPA